MAPVPSPTHALPICKPRRPSQPGMSQRQCQSSTRALQAECSLTGQLHMTLGALTIAKVCALMRVKGSNWSGFQAMFMIPGCCKGSSQSGCCLPVPESMIIMLRLRVCYGHGAACSRQYCILSVSACGRSSVTCHSVLILVLPSKLRAFSKKFLLPPQSSLGLGDLIQARRMQLQSSREHPVMHNVACISMMGQLEQATPAASAVLGHAPVHGGAGRAFLGPPTLLIAAACCLGGCRCTSPGLPWWWLLPATLVGP